MYKLGRVATGQIDVSNGKMQICEDVATFGNGRKPVATLRSCPRVAENVSETIKRVGNVAATLMETVYIED